MAESLKVSTKCSLCGSEKTLPLFISQNVHGRQKLSDENFGIYECNTCKVTFTKVDINEAYYKKYYLKDYYGKPPTNFLAKSLLKNLGELSFKRKLKIINKHKPHGNKILEIGCAQGGFLSSLPSYFEKHGVEVNQDAVRFIKENFKNISVYNSISGENGLDGSESQFDIIVMWQTLEHIYEPEIFLRHLIKLLSKKGILIFDIPNRNSLGFSLTKQKWFHIDTPRHLFHFNYSSLENLLNKTGLKIIKYSGNPIDYFQDLAFSLYMKFAGGNPVINLALGLVVIPIGLIVRFVTSIIIISCAEINTYVVKHST